MNSFMGLALKSVARILRAPPRKPLPAGKKDPLAKPPEQITARLVSRADKTPVSGARYVVLDEKGNEVAKGTTDLQGLVQHDVPRAGKYSIGVSDPPQSASTTRPAPKKDEPKKKESSDVDVPNAGPIAPPPEPPEPPEGPVSDIEAQVIAGDWQKKGFYKADGTGFVDTSLNALLKKYAAMVGVDPKEVESKDGAGAKGSGDLEQSFAKGLPRWLGVFQKEVAGSSNWGTKEQVLSRLMGAYYYRFFRKLYAKHNAANPGNKLAMPASVEYFLLHLGKSLNSTQQPGPPKSAFRANGNGQANFETIGGGGPNYCAAASSVALKKGLAMYGWKMNVLGYAREHGLSMLKCLGTWNAKGYAPRPGDVLSIRSAGGPKTGHVVTVVYSIDMNGLDSGTMWVVSGNAMLNSVAVDFYNIEKPAGERPQQGKIMILNCTTNSDIHFAHWAGEDLSRFKCSNQGAGTPPDYPSAETEKLPDEPLPPAQPGDEPPDGAAPPAPGEEKKPEDEKLPKGEKKEPPPVVGDVQSKPKDQKVTPQDIPIDAPPKEGKKEEPPKEEEKKEGPPPDPKVAPKVLRTLNSMSAAGGAGDAKAMVAYILKRVKEAPSDIFSAADYGTMPASPDEQWARAVAEHLTPLPYLMPEWYYGAKWGKHLKETGEYPLVGQCQQSVSTALYFHGWDGGPYGSIDCSVNTAGLFKQKGELFKPPSGFVKRWSEDDWKRLKPGSVFLWGQPDPKLNSGHVAIVLRKHPSERKFQVWDTGGMNVRMAHQDEEPDAVKGQKCGSYEESWHETVPAATNAPLIGIGNFPLGAVRTDLKARGVACLLLRSRADSKVLYRSKWIRMDEKGLSKLRLMRSLRGAPGAAEIEARWMVNSFDIAKPEKFTTQTSAICDFVVSAAGLVTIESTGKCPDIGNFAKRKGVPKADWMTREPFDEGAKGAPVEL